MRNTQRERQRHRQREKHVPCREPEVGLDPKIPGSRPEPKADAQPLNYPGVPPIFLLEKQSLSEILMISCIKTVLKHFLIFF